MQLAAGQWARTTKRPLFQEVSREWMDRMAEVGSAPLVVRLEDRRGVCAVPIHIPLSSVPPTLGPQRVLLSGPRLQGREPLGPGSPCSQLLTSLGLVGLLCPKATLLNPRNHFPYNVTLQSLGAPLTFSFDSDSPHWLGIFRVKMRVWGWQRGPLTSRWAV